MTNKEFVSAWSKGKIYDGKTSNGTIIVKQGVIYSYGEHFIIAKFTDNGASVTSRKYSSTTSRKCSSITSRHISLVHNALMNENVNISIDEL